MTRKLPGVFRRGRRWYISWNDQFGRRHKEVVGPSFAEAIRARLQRLAHSRAGRFGLLRPAKALTLAEFVETQWRREVAIAFKPSTLRGYETLFRHHLLPYFGHYPLPAITRAEVKRFIAEKARQQCFPYSSRNPNPDRPVLSPKTIKNAVGLLVGVMETATTDYGLLESNPIRGMLRRRHFPTTAHRRVSRANVLEPQDFMRAVCELHPPVLQAVLFAALTGLRWGELVALRTDDVDLTRNRIRITRALYRRVAQIPKTQQSIREVDLCPTAREILKAVSWRGYVFSLDGTDSPRTWPAFVSPAPKPAMPPPWSFDCRPPSPRRPWSHGRSG